MLALPAPCRLPSPYLATVRGLPPTPPIPIPSTFALLRPTLPPCLPFCFAQCNPPRLMRHLLSPDLASRPCARSRPVRRVPGTRLAVRPAAQLGRAKAAPAAPDGPRRRTRHGLFALAQPAPHPPVRARLLAFAFLLPPTPVPPLPSLAWHGLSVLASPTRQPVRAPAPPAQFTLTSRTLTRPLSPFEASRQTLVDSQFALISHCLKPGHGRLAHNEDKSRQGVVTLRTSCRGD